MVDYYYKLSALQLMTIYRNVRNVEHLLNNGVLFSTLTTNTTIGSNIVISCKTDNLYVLE